MICFVIGFVCGVRLLNFDIFNMLLGVLIISCSFWLFGCEFIVMIYILVLSFLSGFIVWGNKLFDWFWCFVVNRIIILWIFGCVFFIVIVFFCNFKFILCMDLRYGKLFIVLLNIVEL